MKVIKYSELAARKQELRRIRIAVRESFAQRPVRTRPRDPEEARVLLKLAQLRRERALASGKVEILGPRHYRFRILSGHDRPAG